jgi:hypothetical protein
MIAIAGRIRVMLLTRHMPLRDALANVTRERILDHLFLFDETLRSWGFPPAAPRARRLESARGREGSARPRGARSARAGARRGSRARPERERTVSPDSIFIAAAKGAYDGVLALYHDQAFIPVKLAAQEDRPHGDRGLEFPARQPRPRKRPSTSPAKDAPRQELDRRFASGCGLERRPVDGCGRVNVSCAPRRMSQRSRALAEFVAQDGVARSTKPRRCARAALECPALPTDRHLVPQPRMFFRTAA